MSTLAEQYRPLRKFSLGDKENIVVRLVLINIVIFAALIFTKVVYMITNAPSDAFVSQVIPWAVLPADPMKVLTHPWTLITYMFVHINFWLLLSSVIWLWGYGELLQGLYGPRFIIPLYLLGGLAGALFFVLSFQLIPGLHAAMATADSIHIGASASVMAIVICTTVLVPRYKIFPMLAGGIPLYVITLIYLVLNIVGAKGDPFHSYLVAEAGGLLLGLYFGYRIKNGFDPGAGLNRFIYKFSHLFEPKDEPYSNMEPLISSHHSKRNDKSKTPYKRIGPISESKIDELLDKINRSGFKSLTAEEKDILIKASKENEEGIN